MRSSSLASLGLILILAFCRAETPEEIPLWPNLPVDQAGLTIYPPTSPSLALAVVICPGGGYGHLAMDKEGHAYARFLADLGVTGVVLRYRMPDVTSTGQEMPWPQRDVARAIEYVRAHAREWKVDRVGVMGSSAGGHLAASSVAFGRSGQAEAADPLEHFSSRPDFLILIYPVVSFQESVGHAPSRRRLLGENPPPEMIDRFSMERQVKADWPPTFIVHAYDDPVKVENSLNLIDAFEEYGVPVQAHIYPTGGHGYGLAQNRPPPLSNWPNELAGWLRHLEP